MSANKKRPSLSGDTLQSARNVSNMLALWALCREPACRKIGACRATQATCWRECVDLVPTRVGAFVYRLFEGKDENLDFDDAIARVPKELQEEWCAWHQAVTRITGRPSDRRHSTRTRTARLNGAGKPA